MRGLASQFLQSGHAIGFGVEGGLEAPDRCGAVLQHLPGPAHPLGLKLLQGHHSIHQPHRQRFIGTVLPAQEPDLACLALSHEAGQIAGTEATIDGEDILIMKQSDIMGIIEQKKKSKKAA